MLSSKDNLITSTAGPGRGPTATLMQEHQQDLEIPIFDVSAQTTVSAMHGLRQTPVVITPPPPLSL